VVSFPGPPAEEFLLYLRFDGIGDDNLLYKNTERKVLFNSTISEKYSIGDYTLTATQDIEL